MCLDKRLQGNHKCRPDSGHDECCICLEVSFSIYRPFYEGLLKNPFPTSTGLCGSPGTCVTIIAIPKSFDKC